MSTQVTNKFQIFNDTNGTPLESGYIYIGTSGFNAQESQISIYSDVLLTVPISQPVRTLNGYPVNNGVPINIYTSSDFSMMVLDKNNGLVYSSLSGNKDSLTISASLDSGTYIPTIASLSGASSIVSDTCIYTRVLNTVVMSGSFSCIPSSTSTDTSVSVSLPIDSVFTTYDDAKGTISGTRVKGGLYSDISPYVLVLTFRSDVTIATTINYSISYLIK